VAHGAVKANHHDSYRSLVSHHHRQKTLHVYDGANGYCEPKNHTPTVNLLSPITSKPASLYEVITMKDLSIHSCFALGTSLGTWM